MSEPEVSSTAILLKLIEAQGKQIRALADSVEAGHNRSSESRGKLHERIDEVVGRLGTIEGGIAILGQADAQVRGEVRGLAEKVDAQAAAIKPAVDAWTDFGKLMTTGRRVSLIFGVSGITLVGWVTGAGEGLWHWLRARF